MRYEKDVINMIVVYILTLCCLVSYWSRERKTSCESLIEYKTIVCHFGFGKCVKCV